MIKIPMEDLLKKTNSTFKLVNLAARRTVELNEGYKAKIEVAPDTKNCAIALTEIADGKIEFTLEA